MSDPRQILHPIKSGGYISTFSGGVTFTSKFCTHDDNIPSTTIRTNTYGPLPTPPPACSSLLLPLAASRTSAAAPGVSPGQYILVILLLSFLLLLLCSPAGEPSASPCCTSASPPGGTQASTGTRRGVVRRSRSLSWSWSRSRMCLTWEHTCRGTSLHSFFATWCGVLEQ